MKSATDCCQLERQIQQDAWDSLHIARVSQQFLHKNCPQMIENDQWPPNNSPNLNEMQILSLGYDAWSYLETFIWNPQQFLN